MAREQPLANHALATLPVSNITVSKRSARAATPGTKTRSGATPHTVDRRGSARCYSYEKLFQLARFQVLKASTKMSVFCDVAPRNLAGTDRRQGQNLSIIRRNVKEKRPPYYSICVCSGCSGKFWRRRGRQLNRELDDLPHQQQATWVASYRGKTCISSVRQ